MLEYKYVAEIRLVDSPHKLTLFLYQTQYIMRAVKNIYSYTA